MQVSEAALYRHFASKAQMFEGLIEFIETSIFTVVNQIAVSEPYGMGQARKTVAMLLAFAERNRGITRVLTGDALVTEDNRLQERINHINDRIEASLKRCLRVAVSDGALPADANIAAHASLLTRTWCWAAGCAMRKAAGASPPQPTWRNICGWRWTESRLTAFGAIAR